MCVLNALRGDSKLEMGGGVKGLDVKKFDYRTKCNFSFPNMLSLSNPKITHKPDIYDKHLPSSSILLSYLSILSYLSYPIYLFYLLLYCAMAK